MFWSDRQRYIPGHVRHKILRFGATRNLVIRFPKSDMNPESVRDDLEHIHLLEVVDISFVEGHLHVSLNDINTAAIARSCMSSRLKYKGSRIEFFPDECSAPLPRIVKKAAKPAIPALPAKTTFNVNRFQMLTIDSSTEDEDETEGLNSFEGFGRADWADQAVVA